MTPSASSLQAALAAASAKAEALGVAVNIAVVDGGGNLAAFLRMPGAFQASIEIAIDKAWTANSFGMSTAAFSAMLESEAAAVRDGLLRRPRITAIPGGYPVRLDGNLAGGLGVSGASAAHDEEIAMSGLNALLES
jgi:glc operon protein GlcG